MDRGGALELGKPVFAKAGREVDCCGRHTLSSTPPRATADSEPDCRRLLDPRQTAISEPARAKLSSRTGGSHRPARPARDRQVVRVTCKFEQRRPNAANLAELQAAVALRRLILLRKFGAPRWGRELCLRYSPVSKRFLAQSFRRPIQSICLNINHQSIPTIRYSMIKIAIRLHVFQFSRLHQSWRQVMHSNLVARLRRFFLQSGQVKLAASTAQFRAESMQSH